MQRFVDEYCQPVKFQIMKKYLSILFKAIVIILISFLFVGCRKDGCMQRHTYTWFEPLYKTTEQVRANIKSNPPRDIKEPGKIVIQGKYIFLNEVDRGIHIIDNSNPSSPRNIAFVDIPGNVDIASKGNILYADFFTDLVTLDISNPLNVVKKNITNGVFPERFYGFSSDSSMTIFDWARHDTTYFEDCNHQFYPNTEGMLLTNDRGAFYSASSSQNISSSGPVGITGSMSRFALVNDYLYAVGNIDLSAFNISNSAQPIFSDKIQVDWHVETVYPFKNKLFVGSNNGVFIYDISSSPETPVKVGEFTHARACDPVVADDNYAYVTLHSGTECLGYNNQLDVVKLNNLSDAELVKTYNLTSPHGLSKDGNLLFICDGTDGLKVYDAKDIFHLKLIKQVGNLETYDVIAYNKKALVVAADGIYQYDYSNDKNIHLISKITISK